MPLPMPRLTAQIFELRNQLAQATIPTNSVGPMLPSALPPPSGSRPAEGAVTNPERCASSSSTGHPPAQAAGGQGYIYVVDPALHVEIERLRETVADRERVIENMQTEERHQSSYEVSAARIEAHRMESMGGGGAAKLSIPSGKLIGREKSTRTSASQIVVGHEGLM